MHEDHRDEQHDLGPAEAAPKPEVVSTTDPVIAQGPSADLANHLRPDETIVSETSQVTDSRRLPEPIQVGQGQSDPHREDHPDPASHANHSGWIHYVMTGLIALACGMGGAWAFSHFASSKDKDQSKNGDPSKKEDSSKSQAKGQGDDSSGGSGSMGANDKDQIENLSARFDALRRRLDSMTSPRDTNPPDLAALRVRVDDLTRSFEDVKGLPPRFRQIEDRLDRWQAEMKGLRDQLASEKARHALDVHAPIVVVGNPGNDTPPVRTPTPPAPPTSVPPANHSSPDDAMVVGMTLFKNGKYPQAEAIFRNLQVTKPEDARVWYYSALANGFTTGQWDGQTRNFVIQGAEREKAGLPPTPEIDSAFADLNRASGKDWLSAYRAQLIKK